MSASATTAAAVGSDVIAELRAALGEDRVVTSPDQLPAFSRDEAEWAPVGAPLAAVRARTTEDVQAVVAACARHGVPVVARGAGTGLSGGANAIDGCVVVSLAGMDRILAIDPLERYAVVEPGVVNDVLRAAVAEHGLWYPPDPASSPWSTIGGNVGTNAGGVCCVGHGVTRDHVLELVVVTGTGDVVRVGRAALELVDRHCLAAGDAWKHMGLSVDAEVVLLAGAARPGAHRGRVRARGAGAGDARPDRGGRPPARRPGRRHRARRRRQPAPADHPRAGDEPARVRAQAAFTDILDAAPELGGTVGGEHGVGLLKKPGLHRELAPEVVAVHRAIKSALDPHGILDPGKVFDA